MKRKERFLNRKRKRGSLEKWGDFSLALSALNAKIKLLFVIVPAPTYNNAGGEKRQFLQ